MIDEPTRHLFTVDDYYRMAEAGILGPEERVELFEGEILVKESKTPSHAHVLDVLTELFMDRFASVAHVRNQSPVRLSRWSEPEPDLVLARRGDDGERRYRAAHPTPDDLLLVVEVADASLDFDLGPKAHFYARFDVPELWVVDLPNRRVHVGREPTPRGYVKHRVRGQGDSVWPLAFPEVGLSVDEIFG